jgi:hypothetical protein
MLKIELSYKNMHVPTATEKNLSRILWNIQGHNMREHNK